MSAVTLYVIVAIDPIGIFIPESERYQALLAQPVEVERSTEPGGIEVTTNHVNPDGISSVTGI